MQNAPQWSEDQLESGRQRAIDRFRSERLVEPLEQYLDLFDVYQGHMENLLEMTVDLTRVEAVAAEILTDESLLDAFRYVMGPSVSLDDLKVLANTNSLNRARLAANPALARSIVAIVIEGHDRRRFPWLGEGRAATDEERRASIVASAALIAEQRTKTTRRSAGKADQEAAVADTLEAAGYRKVEPRTIATLDQAPAAGEFCGESLLGSRKADFVFRMPDRRILAIECKVSNSSTNSVKRLNNDAAVKAKTWRDEWGSRSVVPAAVLSGVYKIHNLLDAQQRGLTLFWAHDLDELTAWVATTRP
ncbi:MAG: XamI family restriction endonuclease [Planctomycetota bacterium]